MEYSSLEEAYPNVEMKKKSKKSKRMPLSYTEESADPDPDRQACRRMPYVEAFQDISANVPAILKANTHLNFDKESVPNYFGKGLDDTEPFANYSNVIGDDPTYRLNPDFTKQFLGQGLDKPAGVPPAEPNLDMEWKPLTAGGVTTASFKIAPPGPGPRRPPPAHEREHEPSGRDEELHKKIEDLYRRIAELDRQRSNKANAQTEVLMFVSSGLALILLLHGLTAGRG
jgi:hypothetical protein